MASRVPSRPLTFQVTFAVLALAVCAAAALVGFGAYAALLADRDALATQRAFVANGLKEQIDATAQQQESVTLWDDAVTFTRLRDDGWMSENLSVWMHAYYGHDRVYVLDEFNDPIHAMVDGVVVESDEVVEVATALLPLVERVRLLTMRIASGELPEDTKPAAGDLAAVGGIPAIVGVMPIVPFSNRVTVETGTEYIHIAVQQIDATLIGAIAEHYHLSGARLAPLAAEMDNAASMPLMDSKGAILGYITWERDRPGLTFIRKTAPALIGTALLGAFLLAFLLRRLRRASAQLERSQNETEFLAFHDTLTGLPNRALFDDRLQRAHVAAIRGGTRIALLYVDLDRFKHVNDTLGHAAGDELVRQTGSRLKAAVRATDSVARLGGDEFALIMEGIRDMRAAEDMSAHILADIARPFELMGDQVHIGASIGIAIGPDVGGDHVELLRKADIALYEAKKKGRGRYEVFAGDMDELIIRRRLIESELRTAMLDGSGLKLVYQPVYAADSTTIAGAEALMRWDHPVHGGLPPGQFIAIAEERGMMKELGEWVLHSACAFAAQTALPWIAVNVSPVQLREADFADRLAGIAAGHGLALDRLQVEITEGVLLDNGDHTRRNLARLRKAGIRVALDDFGTGYSSVNYLRRYGIDKLKVDRSFVHMLGKDDASAPIVKAIIDLAKALDVTVTIEGVETVRQRDIVLALGAAELQGYYFSAPLEADAMVELLAGASSSSRFRPANRA